MRPILAIAVPLTLLAGVAAQNGTAPTTAVLPSARIVFHSDRTGNSEIYRIAADGSNEIQLTNNHADDSFPSWSPDGESILFQSNRNNAAELLQFISDSDSLLDETRTGVLSQDEFDALSTLCRYVNQAWELDADMPLYFGRLRADLQFKTQEEPSYLTEYKNAVELFNLVVSTTSGVEQAWASLLFSEFDVENLASTKLGRARRLVFAELIKHQIPVSGAFKSFGLWNYGGYFGGSFTAPDSYRRGAV